MMIRKSILATVHNLLKAIGLIGICSILLAIPTDAYDTDQECYMYVCNETLWQMYGWNYDNYSYFLESALYAKEGYPKDFIVTGLTKDSYIYHTCSGDFCPALMKADYFFIEAFRNMSAKNFTDEYLLNRSIFYACIASSYIVDLASPVDRANRSKWSEISESVYNYSESLKDRIEFDTDLHPFELGCSGLGCIGQGRGVATSIRMAVQRERYRFKTVLEQLRYRPAVSADGKIYIEELFTLNESDFRGFEPIFNASLFPHECEFQKNLTEKLAEKTIVECDCVNETIEVEKIVTREIVREIKGDCPDCPVCEELSGEETGGLATVVLMIGGGVVGFVIMVVLLYRWKKRLRRWATKEGD